MAQGGFTHETPLLRPFYAMEKITSRQNPRIAQLRLLAADRAARRAQGLYVCDGEKLLRDALAAGITPVLVLWGAVPTLDLPSAVPQYLAPPSLLTYASPLVSSPGPLFALPLPVPDEFTRPRRVLVLENMQDPGNVGTVIRTANALETDLVILTGASADPFGPKAARAAMGALLRQRVLELPLAALGERLRTWDMPLWGAALSKDARDVRGLDLRGAAVAVGNEGHGLSAELLDLCTGQLIIPMAPESESLNAAVAAAILMWVTFSVTFS